MAKCKDCSALYEPNVVRILDHELTLDGGRCPECRRKYIEQMRAAEQARRAMELARQRMEWRRSCGIPPQFQDKDFSNFDRRNHEKLFKVCWDYAERFPLEKPQGYPSLVLLSPGSWGVGKTHLACAIAHRILDRWQGETARCPVHFTTEPDLFRRIRATYDWTRSLGGRETEEEIYLQLATVGLLVVDDVGKEATQDGSFVRKVLFTVIDLRYRNMLPVILTANGDLESLRYHLGGDEGNEASFDRLVEMTRGKFIQVKGESYRRLKVEEL